MRYDSFPEQCQIAVKKMSNIWKHDKIGSRLEGVDPLDHFVADDDLIRGALEDEPRTIGLFVIQKHAESGHGRRNRHELYGPRGQRSAAGYHAAKREAEQAQIRTVVSISRPLDYGERIFYFADTIGIVTLARADTAKVESHGRDPEIIHGAGQCIHDLIKHRALELRMRVAQNSDQRSPEFFRFLEQGLQLASRARDIQRLFDRLPISHDASFYVPFIDFCQALAVRALAPGSRARLYHCDSGNRVSHE